MLIRKTARIAMFLTTALALIASAYSADKGHANEADLNAILSAYPALFIAAIRINPLPKGTRDIEWEKVRNQFVADEKLAIFGASINQKST